MIIILVPGVEDAGEPAVGGFPTDFRKLNIRDQSSEIENDRNRGRHNRRKFKLYVL